MRDDPLTPNCRCAGSTGFARHVGCPSLKREATDRLVQPQQYPAMHGAAGIALWLPERGPEDTVIDHLRLTLVGPKHGAKGYASLDTYGVDKLIEELQSLRKVMVER